MNESQELTYWTEGEKRNLLSPDWEYFSQIKIPALALIDLLALSSELDHRFVHPTEDTVKLDGLIKMKEELECQRDWYPTMPLPEGKQRAIEQIKKLIKRIDIAQRHLAPYGELHIGHQHHKGLLTEVWIVNFVRLANKMKWDIPDELNQLASKVKYRTIVFKIINWHWLQTVFTTLLGKSIGTVFLTGP